MRVVTFNQDVRAAVHAAAIAKGFAADFVDGCLEAIALDIGRVYDQLVLRPPDHPERRIYQRMAEGLGLVEAVCEEQSNDVVVISLRVRAFS